MLELPDTVWRGIEAQTIEQYLAPQFDPQNPPSVEKNLLAQGYDPAEVSVHALIKTMRYATAGAAFILQTDELVHGDNNEAQFRNPLLPYPDQKDMFLTGTSPLDDLARNIKYTYRQKSWDLRHQPDSPYKFLTTQYSLYSTQDVAPTANGHLGFVRNGGGLPDAIVTFFEKLQPGVNRYLDHTNKTDIITIYHDLAILGISRATHHMAAEPNASTLWDEINPDDVTIIRRGNAHTAVDKSGRPLIRAPQHPDSSADPIELERPRLKCPAHAHIGSRIGSALKRAFHASINTAAEQKLI